MAALVAALLHNKDPEVPEASRCDVPHALVTVTVGASGIAFGEAVPLPVKLVHPPTVCVTV